MFRVIVGSLLALALSTSVLAQTPPEVMKPYKEYRAALEAGDHNKAYKAAEKAWEKAEDVLGDSKTTGDLAANFAALYPTKNYNYKAFQSRMEAHKRSIELAKYYTEDLRADIELDRHIKRIELGMSLVKFRNGREDAGGNLTYFNQMEKALDKYDQRGTTFEADMEVLRVRYHELKKNPEKGVEAAKRAETLYASATDGLVTHYPIMLKLFKGNVLNDAGQPIEAVLEYQDVMQNLEGDLPADHVFVSTAFKEWVKTRTDIVDSGRFKEAEAAGLCRCWPFEEYEDDVIPLERIPPIMPRNARRSGHVNLVFDVDLEGKPINIRVLNSTEEVFEKPAMKSVAAWQYSPIGHGETEAKIRKGVSTKISFRLTNQRGDVIPEREN